VEPQSDMLDAATLSAERLLVQYAILAPGTPRIPPASSSFPHLAPVPCRHRPGPWPYGRRAPDTIWARRRSRRRLGA